MTYIHEKNPARIAQRIDLFRCQEQTTAIAAPKPIPVAAAFCEMSAMSMVVFS
jgi:hypothetical protein